MCPNSMKILQNAIINITIVISKAKWCVASFILGKPCVSRVNSSPRRHSVQPVSV